MAQMKFMNYNGSVRYELQKLPGCCGIALVHTVHFYPNNRRKRKLFKDFHTFLSTDTSLFNLARSKVLMTDNLSGDITKFCRFNGWEESSSNLNKKTGRRVATFQINRK